MLPNKSQQVTFNHQEENMSLKGVTLHFTPAYPKLVKSQHCFWINVFSPPYNNPDLIELYIF